MAPTSGRRLESDVALDARNLVAVEVDVVCATAELLGPASTGALAGHHAAVAGHSVLEAPAGRALGDGEADRLDLFQSDPRKRKKETSSEAVERVEVAIHLTFVDQDLSIDIEVIQSQMDMKIT